MGTPIKIKPNTNILDGTGEPLSSRRLTLVHPFFGEEERFEKQYQNWISFSEGAKNALDIVVVDDHGTPSVMDMFTPSKRKRCNLNLSIYRVEDDLKYSTPGALNLGIMTASTPWILIMDSDCLFEPNVMDKLLSLHPKRGWDYKFDRLRVTNDTQWAKNERYLPCTILFHKEMFLEINGFDEDFTGSYCGGYGFFDNHFDVKVEKAGYHCGRVPDIIATEYMPDFVGPPVQRGGTEHNIGKKLYHKKLNGEEPLSNKMMRFSWKRVYHNVRNPE